MSHLYIHIPWCVKKCPYCDFNSHEGNAALYAKDYLQALIKDFEYELEVFKPTSPIQTIFIGGGYPELNAWSLVSEVNG